MAAQSRLRYRIACTLNCASRYTQRSIAQTILVNRFGLFNTMKTLPQPKGHIYAVYRHKIYPLIQTKTIVIVITQFMTSY